MKVSNLFHSCLIALAFALPTISQAREGEVSSLLYNCNMSFSARGQSVAIGIGWSRIRGKGEIQCYDLLKRVHQRIPITVEGRGPSFGLKASGFNLSGAAAGIGISRGPRSLLGSYVGVKGSAAFVKGVGVTVALRLANSNVSINVAINGESGFGAGADTLVIDLREDSSREEVATPVAVEDDVKEDSSNVEDTPKTTYEYVATAPVQTAPPAMKTPELLSVNPGQMVLIKDGFGRVQYIIQVNRKSL